MIEVCGCAGPRIVTRNHPLPLTEAESIQLDFILMVLAAVFVLIPFCYLSGVVMRLLACMPLCQAK